MMHNSFNTWQLLKMHMLFLCVCVCVFCHTSQLPDQGSNPCPLQWKCRVLTTGLPRNSQGSSGSRFGGRFLCL